MDEKEDEEKDSCKTESYRRPSSMKTSVSVVLFGTSIAIAILSAIYSYGFAPVSFYESYIPDPSVEPEIINLFMSYDQNLDGRIDPKEFVQIADRMLGIKQGSVLGIPLVEENWDQNGEKLTVNASFQPLILSTMTKFSGSSFTGIDHPIEKLKSWRQLAKPVATFPVSAFSVFLPPEHLKPDEPWYIIMPQTSKYGPNLSSYRYIPPPVHGNGVLIHYLLSMFHSRPFIMSRFGPQGTTACIQAYNDKYLKIAFRIHGEFQLNEPPLLPFWFSPAQFSGNIIISRDGKHIKSFHMAVPNNRSLNVDMEWLLTVQEKQEPQPSKENINTEQNEEDGSTFNMEVDIGYVPQMEVNSVGPSCISNDSIQQTETCDKPHYKHLVWESEITQEEVEETLVKFLYPFKEVTYLPFKEAFKQAKQQHKPVHHILLWGALDDQSC